MVITWTQDDQGKKNTTVQFNGNNISFEQVASLFKNMNDNDNGIEDKNVNTPRTMAPSPSPMAYPRRVVDFGDFDDEKSIDENTPDENIASEQQTLANDFKKYWRVIMETPDTMLITPTPNSKYADFPNKIDTQGLYHRPIYYYIKKGKKRVWRGYWISKNSKVAGLVYCPI
jgi:hypothetical protein